MPEREKRVETFLVEYVCDECGRGEMVGTGLTKTVDPPLFEHKCNNCGFTADYRGVHYPGYRYKVDGKVV